jgi:hypothetical protein
MPLLEYLVRKGEISKEQVDSLQYYLDLELYNTLLQSETITKGRLQYRFENYIKLAVDDNIC